MFVSKKLTISSIINYRIKTPGRYSVANSKNMCKQHESGSILQNLDERFERLSILEDLANDKNLINNLLIFGDKIYEIPSRLLHYFKTPKNQIDSSSHYLIKSTSSFSKHVNSRSFFHIQKWMSLLSKQQNSYIRCFLHDITSPHPISFLLSQRQSTSIVSDFEFISHNSARRKFFHWIWLISQPNFLCFEKHFKSQINDDIIQKNSKTFKTLQKSKKKLTLRKPMPEIQKIQIPSPLKTTYNKLVDEKNDNNNSNSPTTVIRLGSDPELLNHNNSTPTIIETTTPPKIPESENYCSDETTLTFSSSVNEFDDQLTQETEKPVLRQKLKKLTKYWRPETYYNDDDGDKTPQNFENSFFGFEKQLSSGEKNKFLEVGFSISISPPTPTTPLIGTTVFDNQKKGRSPSPILEGKKKLLKKENEGFKEKDDFEVFKEMKTSDSDDPRNVVFFKSIKKRQRSSSLVSAQDMEKRSFVEENQDGNVLPFLSYQDYIKSLKKTEETNSQEEVDSSTTEKTEKMKESDSDSIWNEDDFEDNLDDYGDDVSEINDNMEDTIFEDNRNVEFEAEE